MKARSSSRQKWLYSTIGLSVMLCIVILSLNGLKAKASINKLNETIKSEISKLTTNQTSDSAKETIKIDKISPPSIVEDTKSDDSKGDKQVTAKKDEGFKVIGNGTQIGPRPLIFIDGKESSQSIESINPNDIYSIQVLKDASATKIYGDKGKNGVILITKKKVDASSVNNEGKMSISEPVKLHAEIVYDKEKDAGSALNEVKINKGLQLTAEFYKSIPQPLILVDGKEAPANFMRNVSPVSIESITVLKDTAATRIYNTKGKNGVILIKMKGKLNMQ